MLLERFFGARQPAISNRRQTVHRVRPLVEALEDRTLLATRLIVPLEIAVDNSNTFHSIQAALTTSGLASGDIIEIQAGSTPGSISGSALTDVAVNNLTIRGNAFFGASELPTIGLSSAQTIAEDGWVIENLNLFMNGSSSLTFNGANARLTDLNISSDSTASSLINLNNSTGAVIEDSSIVSFGGTGHLIHVGANSSGSVIDGNDFRSFSASSQILVNFADDDPTGTQNATVSFNTFLGNSGTADLLNVGPINGLTIIDNEFFDSDSNQVAIDLESGNYRNVVLIGNEIRLTGSTGVIGVDLTGGGSGTTTSVTLSGNEISTDENGTAVRIAVAAGTFNVNGQANDFFDNNIGVEVTGSGSVNNIDFGGGNQGSLGGNSFRGFTTTASSTSGAIVTSVGSGNGTLNFQGNAFSVSNPEDVIFDNGDSSGLTNVTASSNLTGNAAYVDALFSEFLERPANLNNPNDGGGFLTALNNGSLSAFAAAQQVVRSGESLSNIVEDLYQTLLNRGSDAGGLSYHVSRLQSGVTLEATITAFVTSAEYRTQYGSNFAYVQSLYRNLLQREATTAEINGWVNVMNQNGSNGAQVVANAFVNSAEYRGLTIREFYRDILNRPNPSQAEINGFVNSGLDLLSIQVQFAASSEFQANG